jgi:1-acyl-sn-glycerol-3-phosphate acyltransferase
VIETMLGGLVAFLTRVVTAVRPEWGTHVPDLRPRVYFANREGHGDFALIWAALPSPVRQHTRPVLDGGIWLKSPIRRSIGRYVFNALIIERDAEKHSEDPILKMAEALDQGASLILFPESRQSLGDLPLLPFESGLYRLALARPGIEIVPAWIANLNRAIPKGELIPVPIMSTVSFGMPVRLREGEDKSGFLERARAALMSLRPRENLR